MPVLKTRRRRHHDTASHIGTLGQFDLARDKENAAVGKDDADSREEYVDEVDKGGYYMFLESRGDGHGDAGVDE